MTYVEEEEYKGCIDKMLREVHRVLRPGGKAVFTTKQHITVLAKEVGGSENTEHWCGLDWTVQSQMVRGLADHQ